MGAPVVFRGVPLGSVTRINLVFDPKRSAITIPVYIHINENSIVKLSGENIPGKVQDKIIQHMVQNGLSARLQIQNLVTSQLRIELDYHKDPLVSTRTTDAPNEIPTVPSPMDALQKSLAKLPLQELTTAVNRTMTGISEAIGDGKELKEGIASFRKAFDTMDATFSLLKSTLETGPVRTSTEEILANFNTLSASLSRDLPRLINSFENALSNFSQTSERFRRVSAFADEILNKNSPAVQDMRRALKEAAEAARSLHNLADMLNRNPEALLKGKQGGR